jgi:hypothetical protein
MSCLSPFLTQNHLLKQAYVVTGSSQGLRKPPPEAPLANGAGERVVATVHEPENLETLKSQFTPEQLLAILLDLGTNLRSQMLL